MSKYNGYSEKNKEWTMRYMADKRENLVLNFPKGTKDRYKEHAAKRGKSLTALIIELMERDIKELSGE